MAVFSTVLNESLHKLCYTNFGAPPSPLSSECYYIFNHKDQWDPGLFYAFTHHCYNRQMVLYILTGYRVLGIVCLDQLLGARHHTYLIMKYCLVYLQDLVTSTQPWLAALLIKDKENWKRPKKELTNLVFC